MASTDPSDLIETLMETLNRVANRVDAHPEAFAVLSHELGEAVLNVL